VACATDFRANYVGVVAGMTRRFFDFSEKYGVREREANIITDLPRQYGKPEEYRFYKGDPVASPARTVPRAASRISFESMPKD
jgi:type I restriction enzyme M protein